MAASLMAGSSHCLALKPQLQFSYILHKTQLCASPALAQTPMGIGYLTSAEPVQLGPYQQSELRNVKVPVQQPTAAPSQPQEKEAGGLSLKQL